MKNKFLFMVTASLLVAVTSLAQRPEALYARLAAQGVVQTPSVKISSVTAKSVSAKKALTASPATITSCPSCDTLHFQAFTPDPNFVSIYDSAYIWEHTFEYNEPLPISTYCGYYKFKEGCVNFYHYADTTWAPMIYWDGFTVSKTTSFPTPLPASSSYTSMYDQFSAMPQQGVLGANDPYTVAYYGYNEQSYYPYNHCALTLDEANTLCGMYVTNNAYVYNSIKYGDSFARAFDTGDYFLLTIKGYLNGSLTDTVQYCLADYRGNNPYVITSWRWVNLSALGTVDSVAFDLYTTDSGDWGPNTPMYFCMDELRVGTGNGCGTCPASQYGQSSASSSSSNRLKSAHANDATTAAAEMQAATLQLTVSPNPASTQLTVTAQSGCLIQVFDAQGNLRYSNTMQGETDIFSLAGFKTGIHTVVVSKGAEVKSAKFTKQ